LPIYIDVDIDVGPTKDLKYYLKNYKGKLTNNGLPDRRTKEGKEAWN